MAHPLREARQLAETVRFSLDAAGGSPIEDAATIRKARSFFAQHDLEINPSLTPALSAQLERAYRGLKIPGHAVQSFVFASPDLQAECLSSTRTECLIRFSSALVDLLNDAELRFVAGHEVGHFLLGHHPSAIGAASSSVEHYMNLRYQEVSADRIGMIACGSLGDAIRALMKTCSGLSDRHLRFDVAAFLSQLRHVDDGLELNAMEATHPALVIRARALLWFSMNESFMKPAGRGVQQELRKLDRRVEEDLSRYVDGSVRRLIAEAKDALLLWVVADHVVREGAFRREHQSTIGGFMDGELLDGLRRFLGSLAPETARAEVASRLALASDELRSLIPTTFANEYSEIRQFVAGKLETK